LRSPKEIIKSALNEITAPQRDAFVSVSFCPELVDELSFTQEQLIDWLAESYGRTESANDISDN